MKPIEKFLYTVTDDSQFRIDDEKNDIKWIFNIGDSSKLELQNIENNLISMSIKTTNWNKINPNTKKTIVFPIEDIKNFIVDYVKKINNNIDRNKRIVNIEKYKTIIDNILQEKEVKGFTYKLESNIYDNSKNNTININEKEKDLNHTINVQEIKDTSLLNIIKINAMFIIEEKKDYYMNNVIDMYFSPLSLNKYTLLNKILYKEKFNKEEDFNSIVEYLTNSSIDEKLLKILSYDKLNTELNNTKLNIKNKTIIKI